MTFRELQSVVLVRDIPEHGLRKGDLGAGVLVHETGDMEVEFVRASGYTQALVELRPSDVRPAQDEDILAVRRAGSSDGR
jgi:hypothetical protein